MSRIFTEALYGRSLLLVEVQVINSVAQDIGM